jgi:hypothetical protein
MSELFQGVSFGTKVRIYFSRHRKTVNENLGLIIALLAAAFAGWSGWEAHEARKDALLSLKIAQRSYVDVQDHQVDWPGARWATGEAVLRYQHAVTVYGSTPAFQVRESTTCRLGIAARYKGQITMGDLTPGTFIGGPLSEQLPDEIIPSSKYSSKILCELAPTKAIGGDQGVIVYGVINYEDIFREKHYKHFCYYNYSLVPEVLVNPKEASKWGADTAEAGKHLIACPIYNDGN